MPGLGSVGLGSLAIAPPIKGVGALAKLALNASWAAVGDSWFQNLTATSDNEISTSNTGVLTPLMERLDGKLRMSFKGNKGVGGATVQAINGQVAGMLATMPGPGIVFVDGGFNNIGGSDTATVIADQTASTIATILAEGHRVVLVCMAPARPSTPLAGATETKRQAVNTRYLAMAGSRVKVFSSESIGLLESHYVDQIHLTSAGYDFFAAALAAFIADWMPTGDTRLLGAQTYINNAALAGGANDPTGWSVDTANAGGATVVRSKVGGKWRIAISGTTSGGYIDLTQTTFGSPPPNPAGDSFIEGLASYTPVGAPTNIYSPTVILAIYPADFSPTLAQSNGSTANSDGVVPTRSSGIFVPKTPTVKVLNVEASNAKNVIVRIPFKAAGAVSWTLDFDYIDLRQAA